MRKWFVMFVEMHSQRNTIEDEKRYNQLLSLVESRDLAVVQLHPVHAPNNTISAIVAGSGASEAMRDSVSGVGAQSLWSYDVDGKDNKDNGGKGFSVIIVPEDLQRDLGDKNYGRLVDAMNKKAKKIGSEASFKSSQRGII